MIHVSSMRCGPEPTTALPTPPLLLLSPLLMTLVNARDENAESAVLCSCKQQVASITAHM
jgi:hypothetical protein